MISSPLLILALFFPIITTHASNFPVKIIAHRGASACAPENTLAAFKLALEMGADGIELDVHLSADSRLMVIHDPHTGRTSNKQLNIAETQSAELRTLDVGVWRGEAWQGEMIPFLEEALSLVPQNKHLFIECKSKNPQAFLSALNQLWEKHEERLRSSTFISFHAPILIALKEENPHLTTLLLVEDLHTLEKYIHRASTQAHALFDGIGIDETLPIDEAFIQSIKEHSHILSAWTVNTPQKAKDYHTWGFHYITTDKPDLIRAALIQLNEALVPADTGNAQPRHL